MAQKIKLDTWHKIMIIFLVVTFLFVIIIFVVLQQYFGKPLKEMPVNKSVEIQEKSLDNVKKLP